MRLRAVTDRKVTGSKRLGVVMDWKLRQGDHLNE